MLARTCMHCGGKISDGQISDGQGGAQQKICPHCQIPLSPHGPKSAEKKFLIWFVLVVIFCIFMIVWLPPDWSSLVSK